MDFPAFARHPKELKCNSKEAFMSKGKRYTDEFIIEAVKWSWLNTLLVFDYGE